MTLKGYYPSMSLGFEILLGVINVVAGCTLAVIGAMVVFNKSDVLCGFVYLGVAAIMAGAFVATAGGLAFFGSCREHVPSLRISYILSMGTFLVIAGLFAYVLIISSSVSESARQSWYSLSVEEQEIIENQYSCCGFNTPDEMTEGCEFDQTCDTPVLAELTGKIRFTTIMCAICAIIQIAAVFCGCCVHGSMRTQQEKKMRKQGLTLLEEAQGGYKSKGKKKNSSNDQEQVHPKKGKK